MTPPATPAAAGARTTRSSTSATAPTTRQVTRAADAAPTIAPATIVARPELAFATMLLAAGVPTPAAADSFAMGYALEGREQPLLRAQASTRSGQSVTLSAAAFESGDGAWGVDFTGGARRPAMWLPEGERPARTRWQFTFEAWRAAGPLVMFAGATADRVARLDPDEGRAHRAYAGFELELGGSGFLAAEAGWTAPGPGLATERDIRIGWRIPLARGWSAGFDLSRMEVAGWQDSAAWLAISGKF